MDHNCKPEDAIRIEANVRLPEHAPASKDELMERMRTHLSDRKAVYDALGRS